MLALGIQETPVRARRVLRRAPGDEADTAGSCRVVHVVSGMAIASGSCFHVALTQTSQTPAS